MIFPTPTAFFTQTGVVKTPTVTTDNNMDIWTATTDVTTMCSVQELSGNDAIVQQRFAGQRVAVGYFPPDITLTKDCRVLVTGDGYPTAGRLYAATSPPTSSGGTNAFWIVNLEAVE